MKKVLPYILLTITIGVAIFFAVKFYQAKDDLKNEKAVFNEKVQLLIDANNKRIDQLVQADIRNLALADSFYNLYQKSKKAQKNIETSFKPIYDEIRNTSDSDQLAITKRLLAGHRDTEFKRN